MAMSTRVIDITPVDRPTAAAIEEAECRAWVDLYGAAPADWAAEAGIGWHEAGGALVLRWAATGRRYFSRVIGLGVTRPATLEVLDATLAGYAAAGISQFLLQSLRHCLPDAYEGWLRDCGLEPFDTQDRVVRDGRPLGDTGPSVRDGIVVEKVTRESADEWAAFLQGVYRLDAGPWLQRLVGRARWHQYFAREDGRIVAARGMYAGREGTAWVGMDGPVPGLWTDDLDPDTAILEAIVRDGLALGTRRFVSDIEAPSADAAGPAYDVFAGLGFSRPYARTHWAVMG
jgi:hypothetical protein